MRRVVGLKYSRESAASVAYQQRKQKPAEAGPIAYWIASKPEEKLVIVPAHQV